MSLQKTIHELRDARLQDDTAHVLVFLCVEAEERWNVVCYEEDYPEEGHVFVAEFICKGDAEFFCKAANTINPLAEEFDRVVEKLKKKITIEKVLLAGVGPQALERCKEGEIGWIPIQEVLNMLTGKGE